MAKRKVENRIRIFPTIEMEQYEQLQKLAAKRGVTIPDIVREFIDQGLTNNYCVENIDLITDIIRTQLNIIIKPAVDRMAALSSKACIQSGTAAYLSAEAIAKFVPDELQEDFLDVYEAAKKKAVADMKRKSD